MEQFRRVAGQFEQALRQSPGPFLDPAAPGTADLVFVPYVERMNASLAYYKGYRLRHEHPAIDAWFRALEQQATYRGTQSDHHTHAHDLPPQMGGCWSNHSDAARTMADQIDRGDGLAEDEACWDADHSINAAAIALGRVLRHRERLMERNPLGRSGFDQPLRCALTNLMGQGSPCPDRGSALALRHLRDRISVPRDMPLPAARLLRQALERTAALDGQDQPPPLPIRDRFDQDPAPFVAQP